MSTAQTTAARDELLAQLLAQLIEQRRDGHKPDVEAVPRQHPDLTTELRELWAAAQLADDLGSPDPPAPVEWPDQKGRATQTAPESARPFAVPRIFGDYELLDEIGRGGMGVVFKAHQRSLNRTVALKMILRGDVASGAELA